jgi:F-type H+-transporting ATPase subunit delta
VFHANRWAVVFEKVLGENADSGLACLRALVQPVKAITGELSGHSAARRLEKVLRESIAALGGGAAFGKAATAVEYAVRFLTLVVEKKQFGHISVILRHIEERLDTRKGTMTVTVESAVPLDDVLEKNLRRQIMDRLAVSEVNMKTRLVPQLLGGYRLRLGGFFVDASLKGQIESMKADLEAVV